MAISSVRPIGHSAWVGTFGSAAAFSLSSSGIAPLSLRELAEIARVDPSDVFSPDIDFSYGDVGGSERLRESIANMMPGIVADNVTVTSGAGDALAFLADALCTADAHVIIHQPAHGSVLATARRRGSGITLVSSPTTPEEIVQAITRSTSAVFLTSPNNPTGQVLDESFLRVVGEAAQQVGALVVVDEVYHGIPIGNPVVTPPAASLLQNGVSVGSLSKVFALPGLRLGWAAGPALLVDDVRTLQSMSSRSITPMAEAVGILALDNSAKLLSRARALVYDAFAELATVSERSGLLELVVPDGGAAAFPRLNVPDVDAWCTRAAERYGVLIAPGNLCFGIPGRVRISLGLRPDVRTRALSVLSRALADRPMAAV